eukprot:XP_016659523.1 PREDICTED: uncharacterized protein LOC100573806 [Acyrthosiphon pisum]
MIYQSSQTVSDASILHTEFTTQIVDKIIKQKNGPVIYKDDIDVSYVKNAIGSIKRASCVEPIQPPSLPPSDLMDLGASRINLISTIEPNSSEVTRGNVILSKSSTNIHLQLNTEINKLHTTGSSNKTKPKFISALKPGTLIDLENSKVVCASLHTESLEPVIKSNEKSTEVEIALTDISVSRDPRIRHETLLTSGKNVNPFNTPESLISNAQYNFSTNTQTPFDLKRDNSNVKLLDTTAQEMYNGQSSSSHTTIQLLNPQFSSEQNGNSIQLKNRSLSLNQNKHNRSDDKKNDYSQFSNSTQMHANPSHFERLTKYCDPYKSHRNDASKKDPRTLKSVKTTVYPNYKEHREAKFREQIKSYVKNKNQMNQDHEQYRNLVNQKMEKKKNSQLKIFGDDKNDTDVLKTEKKSKIHLKADTIREQYLVNGQKSETNKSKNSKKDLKITDRIIDSHMNKNSEIEITKNKKDSCPEINLEEITVDIPSTIVCKSQEKIIDSSNEINSTAYNSPKIDENALKDILKNPMFETVIRLFQDEDKIEKLNKLLESSNKNSHLNEFYEGDTSSGNINGHSSTDQHKLKSIKLKKSKENYGNFEIVKDKCKLESKDLKIVIAKLDKNIKRNDNCSSDISSTSNDIQINNKAINVEISQEIKSKKPFIGPLSVKLERKKMEMEINNSQNECDIKNLFEFETKKFRKGSKSIDRFNKKGKLNSETLMTEQPIFLTCPLQNPKPFDDETNFNQSKSVEQNSNTSTFIVNKPEIKKARPSELDKLHADISEIFDREAILNVSKIRQCRTNKQIDYVNTNVVMPNIEPLDSNDDQNEYGRCKKVVKKSMANKNLPPVVVKTAVLNKISSKQQDKLKKTKKRNKKFMKSNRKQLKVVLSDDFELNNVLKNNICTEITSKIVTGNKFKDKFYFQTANNSLECKFCNYKDKGLNIVRHYKDQHCEEEVLPSRLPKNCSESLIQQSLRENFGYQNSQDSKPICHQSVNINYTCVFCEIIFHDYFKFYDHITGHTGEYRYKCKMCEQIYSNEDDLDKHILEHTEYDKTGGISHLIFPNPICSKYTFGYLCSFCYYVQLDYNNIVKHMASQHFDEDKKLNGHWTVIRINMSVADTINTDSSIDFDNLVGCLPPIQSDQVISKSKDNEDQNQQLTVMDLNILSNEEKQPNSILSIEKQSNEQNIDEIPQDSNIDKYSPKSNILENLPKLVTHANPPVTVYDKVLESTKLQILPEQANQSPKEGTRITTDPLAIEYLEYTLKEKSKNCVMAGLSCELIDSMLLFKCSVSNCREIQFSTVVFVDFFKHIKRNHQFVVWDGHCEACHYKLPIVSEQYYVGNALDHLVSHHLDLKNNEQHPNTTANLGGSNIECLSSCQDTVENTPFVKNFLKIRHLPGDKLSTHFIENNMFGNPEQSSHNILLGTQCQTSVNLNINHGSNDGRFPLWITDVKSLKKGNVNICKINSSGVINPNSEIFLEEVELIVNNGMPVDGTIVRLIDTAYTKDYIKKVRDFPMNVMKTQLAFKEMSVLPRLMENQIYNVEQFKMCAYCFKVFDDEESLANHISEKYTFCDYFCPHCFYRAYTATHVLVHQSVIHTHISKHCIIKLEYDDGARKYPKEMLFMVDFKKFVLPYKCNVGCCGFSCYLHNEFEEHLNQEHQQCDRFSCYICANKDDGEGFVALQPSLMITHFKLHNLNKYQCIFCLFGNEIIDSMIKHLALEHFEYEPLCLERSTVSDNCESKNIRNLKILKLTKVIDNGVVEIVKLPREAISVPEVLPQRSKKRSIECPDILSVPMKSARIDKGSQASDTIVITVPNSTQTAEKCTSMSLAIDNEFVMIDDVNQNDMQQTLNTNRIWSESNKENEPKVSSNDDIIVIDDEDDVDLSEKEELNEGPTKRICLAIEESINGSNTAKRLAFPIVELNKLFVCKECAKIFSSGLMFAKHLSVCPSWDFSAGNKCIHCVKVFKTIFDMTEHIKLHGPDRFKCSLCNLKVPSPRAITHHMRNSHKIINLDFVPESPNLTNFNMDDFIVFEDKTFEQKKKNMNCLFTCNKCPFRCYTRNIIISHMKAVHNADQNVNCEENLYKITPVLSNDISNSVNSLMPQQNEQQNASLKRKRFTNFDNQKESPKEKPIVKNQTKILFFSPNTIDSIPKSHIFSDPISCLLCTYSTKVRSNLVIHLNGHTKGQDYTTKEIVNPVINLSASAFDAINTEKIKRDELDKKIVEVALDDTLNTEIFPQFIPKNMRYKCSIDHCTYTGRTEDMLKKHISILHPNYECYICPHCLHPCMASKLVERKEIEFHLMHHGANLYRCQYCEYIDFNRVEMRTHMRNTHLSEITSSVQSNIIVIRQTMFEDESIHRFRSKAPYYNVPQWVCNICSNGLRYTENEITSHILMAHKVSNMFKCPLCQFEHKDDNANIFKEHYKLQHPSVAVKSLRVFEKISDKEELHKRSKHLGGTDNMLKQQALESIEPTLVPPTCRGIPIESTPLKKYTNKSGGIANSSKSATKSTPIQPHKQKSLKDVFNNNELGAISSNGYFVCPKCCVFETMNIELFREHLYREVNQKL